MRRCNLHRLVYASGPHIQRATEQEGETQDIVDLIGEIRPASRDNCVGTGSARNWRGDFGVGVCHRKDDRLIRHGFHHIGRQDIGTGKPQKYVSADDCLS